MTQGSSVPAVREQAPSVLQGKKAVIADKNGNPVFRFIPREVGPGHLIRAAMASVDLDINKGELVHFKAGGNDTWLIGVDGFRKMNQIGAVSIMYPPTQEISDGKGGTKVVGNPYIETDENGGFVVGYTRAVGICRNPFGEVVIIDRPTTLSMVAYLAEDLGGKTKTDPSACAWGPGDMNPLDVVRLAAEEVNRETEERIRQNEADGKQGNDWLKKKLQDVDALCAAVKRRVEVRAWRFLPVHGQDMGIWYDTTHPVVQRVFQTLQQNKKFGPRKLQAIAERNVLRTAFGTYKLSPEQVRNVQRDKYKNVTGATASVVVHYHESDHDTSRIRAILQAYTSGVESELMAAGKPVLIDKAREKATKADIAGVHEGSPEEGYEDGSPGSGEEIGDDLFSTKEATPKVLADVQAGEQIASAHVRKAARDACGIAVDAPLSALDEPTLKKYRDRLNIEIDKDEAASGSSYS